MSLIAALALGFLAVNLSWSQLPSLPDKEGFAGPFAGVSQGVLLVAGGAKFPEKRPWEGGTKRWYSTVYALDTPSAAWKEVGNLPRPLGYGVSASYQGRMICVGGSDSQRHFADCFSLEWVGGRLVTKALPPLPIPVANGCGALVGTRLYVLGGQERPTSSTALARAFALDLADPNGRWVEVPGFPGRGRILATAASLSGRFWVFGGAALAPDKDGNPVRTYLRDAYRYDPATGWKRIADLPHPIVAAPSPAPTWMGDVYVLGGDDGRLVGSDPRVHPGFPRTVLRYDPREDEWTETGEMAVGRVTLPTVAWRGMWVLPNGEARPGVRSPEVWTLRFSAGRD